MKVKIFLFLCIFGIISCKNAGTPPAFFHQLEGKWQRANEKPGLKTYEEWQETEGTMHAVAYTLRGNDTVFKENLSVLQQDKNWFLRVKAPKEPAVLFKITEYSDQKLTAVNPENDFPQKVAYAYKKDTLTATISGGESTIPFIFTRIDSAKKSD